MAIPALDTPETTPAARQPAGAIPVERAVGLPAKLRWSLVGWYRATGALDAAAALLDAVAERDGETIRLIEERARLAVAAGRSDEAVSLLEERAARAPSATAWVQLGRVHLEAGDVDAAAAIADDLMADSAGLQTVAQFAGDVARARGDRTAARAHNEAILEARPDHVGSLLALAAIAVEDGDRRLAAALLDRALDGAEENLTSSQLGAAADVAAEVGRTGQATELRSRASALDAARGAALLAEVHAALGWEPPAASTRFPGAGVAGATAVSPGGSPGTGEGDRRRAAGSGAAGGESDRPAAPSPVADRAAAARPASARRAEEPAPTLGTFAPTPDPDLS
ncbi:MAG: hypothetical protein AVDCRST_MAG49-1979 [uncultured Thermomicrobiales bacterium]|uniref:Uncharacterized protein n=1 Tax=uncultured Thermomicrobiales bacterium TaxID=1645740 RepID=A0A6J4UNN2_9BACT|nr:MAG: hypothetical protein AVDCRST_MAG49-1979 [uncultured Thermomicrobiales bacterium]